MSLTLFQSIESYKMCSKVSSVTTEDICSVGGIENMAEYILEFIFRHKDQLHFLDTISIVKLQHLTDKLKLKV